MKRLRLLLLSLSVLFGGMAALPAISYAATPTQTACSALTGNGNCNDHSGGPSVNKIIKTVINIMSLVIGLVAVIMIIVAGLRYVTSAGDSNAISGAKNTLIFALVGLAVAALAQGLVQFVLNRIT